MLRDIILYIKNAGRKVTSDEIRDRFDIKETTTGNYKTRMLIKEAQRSIGVPEGIPIGADGGGYFYLETLDELTRYRNNLQARIDGIVERMTLAVDSYNNR